MCCSLYKRERWEKLGGYDESMTDGYEDWDLWVRATHAGYTVTSLPRTLFYYRKYHENRSHVRCSVDRGHMFKDEVVAYMRAKWERLGIKFPPPPPPVAGLRYPVRLAVTVQYEGQEYAAGTRVDHPTALGMKKAGLLRDPRIV
jgi:hypothetical protein